MQDAAAVQFHVNHTRVGGKSLDDNVDVALVKCTGPLLQAARVHWMYVWAKIGKGEAVPLG